MPRYENAESLQSLFVCHIFFSNSTGLAALMSLRGSCYPDSVSMNRAGRILIPICLGCRTLKLRTVSKRAFEPYISMRCNMHVMHSIDKRDTDYFSSSDHVYKHVIDAGIPKIMIRPIHGFSLPCKT